MTHRIQEGIQTRIRTPWFIRKALYLLGLVLGLVLVATGIADGALVDKHLDQIVSVIYGLLSAGIGGMAAAKTGPHSDETRPRPVIDVEQLVDTIGDVVTEKITEIPALQAPTPVSPSDGARDLLAELRRRTQS